jgi:hypothetical protein
MAQFRRAWLIVKSQRRQTPIRASIHFFGRGTPRRSRRKIMRRVLGFVVLLVLIGLVGLIGYSYSGYLVPDQTEITRPVDLDVD